MAAAVIWRNGRVLAAQRGPGATRAGYWEFPGGTVESGETDESCLVRELDEELSLQARVGERLICVTHEYPDVRVQLQAFRCECPEGEPVLHQHQAVRWLLPDELGQVTWSEADRPVVAEVQARVASPAVPPDRSRSRRPGQGGREGVE